MSRLSVSTLVKRGVVVAATLAVASGALISGASASTVSTATASSSSVRYSVQTFRTNAKVVSVTGSFNQGKPRVGQVQKVIEVLWVPGRYGPKVVGSLKASCRVVAVRFKDKQPVVSFWCQNAAISVRSFVFRAVAVYNTAQVKFNIYLRGVQRSTGINGTAVYRPTGQRTAVLDFRILVRHRLPAPQFRR